MNRTLAVLLVLLITAGMLAGCGTPKESLNSGENVMETSPFEPSFGDNVIDPGAVAGEAQLLADAQSLEDAQALADLYEITLVEYRDGVATFHTDEDPQDVIRRGQENGWPELSLNQIQSIY